jgi:hypothetical protein
MLKKLFGARPTNQVDVLVAAAAAGLAVINYFGVRADYKAEQAKKENEQ